MLNKDELVVLLVDTLPINSDREVTMGIDLNGLTLSVSLLICQFTGSNLNPVWLYVNRLLEYVCGDC